MPTIEAKNRKKARRLKNRACRRVQEGNRADARSLWREACNYEAAAEGRGAFESFIKHAEEWRALLDEQKKDLEEDDRKLIRGGLGQAETLAQNADDWIKCATAWRELLGDPQNAQRCLRRIEEKATSAASWIECANAWMAVLGDGEEARRCREKAEMEARRCLQIAENTATSAAQWIICATAWNNEVADQNETRRCLLKAEQVARATGDFRAIKGCANAYENLLKDLANRDSCVAEASLLELRAIEAAAESHRSLINCAKRWLDAFAQPEATQRCLTTAATIANTIGHLAECARAWQNLLQDNGQALACLERANTLANTTPAWLECATLWWQLLANHEAARECYCNAQRRARTVSAYLSCARAWNEFGQNLDRVRNCLARADSAARRAESTDDCFVCAQTCLQLENNPAGVAGAIRCLANAEMVAYGSGRTQDWLDCGRKWFELINSIDGARRCYLHAEEAAGNRWQDWEMCVRAWWGLDGGESDADRCMRRAFEFEEPAEYRVQRLEIAAQFNAPLPAAAPENQQDPAQVKQAAGGIPDPHPPAIVFDADPDEDPSSFLRKVLMTMPDSPPPPPPSPPPPTAYTVLMNLLPGRAPAANAAVAPGEFNPVQNRVLFYPACGLDWEPLYRFAGACDTFIYCDRGRLPNGDFDFEHGPFARAGLRCEGVQRLPDILVDGLSGHQGGVHAQGFRVFVSCAVTDPPRLVQLWYFSIEGALLYRNLFNRRKWAPEYLCITDTAAGFEYWESPLGQAVLQNGRHPRFVISRCLPAEDYNWPWNANWLTFNTWRSHHAPVFAYRLPEIVPAALELEAFHLPGIPPEEWPI